MLVSFRSKVLALMVGLVTVAEVGTIAAALAAAQRAALGAAEQELEAGGALFEDLLATRRQQLTSSVTVLAADFAFREAVASDDRPTIESALANHAGRIGADAALLLDLDGRVVASTAPASVQASELDALVEGAPGPGAGAGGAASIIMLEGVPHEFVVVPLLAPLQVGWTAMGFRLDDALAEELAQLTGLDVSFAAGGDAGPVYFASTVPPERRMSTLAPPAFEAQAGGDYFSVRRRLSGAGETGLFALLQVPVERMFESYGALRNRLIWIAALSLGLCCVGAMFVAGQVSRPVARLAAAARRIEGGDYMETLDAEHGGEFAVLAGAFNRMQRGIAEREARLIHQAEHDALTGLPNRVGLEDRIRRAMRQAQARGRGLALVMIGIERFKEIGDTLGHEVSEQVVRAVAAHLASRLRASDAIVQLERHEFLVLLADTRLPQAEHVAGELVASLGETVGLEGGLNVRVRLDAGIAAYPEHAREAVKLLRRADIAMGAAKESEGGVGVYSHGDDERHLKRIAVINALQDAIENERFELHYQPKVDLSSGRVEQVEALVRWTDPQMGSMSPQEFVPLAEQSGDIKALTRWVVGKTAAQVAAWRDSGLHIGAAVNLSALDLLDRTLPEFILATLARHGLDARSLTVEVTESAVMRDAAQATEALQRLRSSGVSISIDDFGTGYSSLAQLKRLPLDELKIDGSFVHNMSEDRDDALICRSTIDLGHHMGLKIVAEGVETAAALERLRAYGCDRVQGYYISAPLQASDLVGWLARSADRHGAVVSAVRGDHAVA